MHLLLRNLCGIQACSSNTMPVFACIIKNAKAHNQQWESELSFNFLIIRCRPQGSFPIVLPAIVVNKRQTLSHGKNEGKLKHCILLFWILFKTKIIHLWNELSLKALQSSLDTKFQMAFVCSAKNWLFLRWLTNQDTKSSSCESEISLPKQNMHWLWYVMH